MNIIVRHAALPPRYLLLVLVAYGEAASISN